MSLPAALSTRGGLLSLSAATAVAGAAAGYLARGRRWSSSKSSAENVRSTTASGSVVYESGRAVEEYLQFHFGTPQEIFPFGAAPQEALHFLDRCVAECEAGLSSERRRRALDVGCAVGGATFRLTRSFEEVVGLDFSQAFVDAAGSMRREGALPYRSTIIGDVRQGRTAKLPSGANPDRAHFEQGDACNIREDIGTFDAVLASNLLCRLPKPKSFLRRLPSLVRPGGVLVLVSPYSWLEEYTPKQEWLGGYEEEGEVKESFANVSSLLAEAFVLEKREDLPFLIREHERKYQYGVSDCSVWRRNEE